MKLGIDAVMYLNTAAPATGWATPTWAAIDSISDLAQKIDWDHAEIVIRRSWVKMGAKTVVDVGITCKMLVESTNTLYTTIRDALRGRATVDVLCLNASLTVVGAEGVRFISQVIKGAESQNTNEAIFKDLEFMPYPDPDPTHIPQWADVTTAGTATFKTITPAGTGSLSVDGNGGGTGRRSTSPGVSLPAAA